MNQLSLTNTELNKELQILQLELNNSNTTIALLKESNITLQNKMNAISLCFKQNENEYKIQIIQLNNLLNSNDKQIKTTSE